MNGTALPWIVSADDHVVEPPGVWLDRLPAALRDHGPRTVKDTCETIYVPETRAVRYVKGGDGPVVDWWLYDEQAPKPIPKVVACAGMPFEEHTIDAIAFEEMRPGCYDPVARLADMDVAHVERSLCFPYITRFAGQWFLDAADKDLALLCVQAYNDWMIDEWCGDSGGRLIPLCIVPLWDAELAAAEVRAAATGSRAITWTEMPSYLGLPSIHDPDRYWDPLFRACDETGTVLGLHIGSGSKMAEPAPWAPRAANTALTFANAQTSLVDWLVSGNLVRFPHLKIVYSEAQIGWMPFVLDRLDKVWEHAEYAGLDPIITEPPSSYVPGRIYGSFFDDDCGIEQRDRIGVTQLVLEMDYPHQDSTWPDTPEILERLSAQVSAEDLERIVRRNALEMLGLD